MAPSPGSLNTPGPAVPTPSPCNLQEDQAYREKVRQLSKYIEPLRRMISRMGNDGRCIFVCLFVLGCFYVYKHQAVLMASCNACSATETSRDCVLINL
jgi:hypothetical protein